MVITYAFLGIFIALMGYFAYFETVKSEDFINSPYNARQDSFSSSTVRGKIMGSGGEILAESNVDAEGKETRTYPYRNPVCPCGRLFHPRQIRCGICCKLQPFTLKQLFLRRIVNEIRGEKNTGDDVVTTLNVSLQQAAYDALGEHDGAVVVMEPSTGRILAMVSKPDFDPNEVAANWEAISGDSESFCFSQPCDTGTIPAGFYF